MYYHILSYTIEYYWILLNMQIYWNLLKSMFAFKSYRRDENWGFEFPVSLLPCQPQCQGFAASNWESGRRTRQLSLQPFFKLYF